MIPLPPDYGRRCRVLAYRQRRPFFFLSRDLRARRRQRKAFYRHFTGPAGVEPPHRHENALADGLDAANVPLVRDVGHEIATEQLDPSPTCRPKRRLMVASWSIAP